MMHENTELAVVTQAIGLGVFATARLARGTIVWTQDRFDRVLSPQEVEALDQPHRAVVERYAHLDAKQNRILCWDFGRYVNHACEPTLRGVGPWFQVARRDVEVGEEITCDYAECNIEQELVCSCVSEGCRETVHGCDLLSFCDVWDAEAQELARCARDVEQPLAQFLLDRKQAEAWLREPTSLPSFRDLCAFGAS